MTGTGHIIGGKRTGLKLGRPMIGLVLLLTGVGASGGAPASPASSFVVSAERARCVAQNAGKYSRVDKNLIVVFLDLCPIIEPSPSQLANRNRASSYVRVKELPGAESNRPRSVLVLTKARLSCFVQQVNRAHANRRAAATIRIDLARC